ncbi:MAG: molybdopterin-dependent oxidoreductase, partial [Eggerthellaceae bacterium]|nr:molybdopterin-dependent oxidoreductase [Eggerthellaceae bacterium]
MSQESTLNRGITRRGFLATTAVAASAAAAGGAGLSALAADPTVASAGEQVFVGRCNYPGCFGCEREVVVRDGKVVNTRPRKEAPYGRRPCSKGYSLMQRLYSEDRTKYPMKRKEGTERGAGEWERIIWDEALSTIAEKFQDAIAKYGSHSVLWYGCGAQADMVRLCLFVRYSGYLMVTSQSECSDWAIYHGIYQVLGTAYAGSMVFSAYEPFEEDVFNARTLMIWGTNPCMSYPQRWRTILDAQANGTRIVCVDPNATQVGLRANMWVRPRPASDVALVLGMISTIFAEGLEDEDFLKTQTVAPFLIRSDNGKFLRMSDLGVEPVMTGYDAYYQPVYSDPCVVWDVDAGAAADVSAVANPAMTGEFEVEGIKVTAALDVIKKHFAQFTPEKMASECEIPADTIRELARINAAGPVMHMYGMGFQHYDNGMHLGLAVATLQAITGNLNKPGTGMANMCAGHPFNYDLMLSPTYTFSNSIPMPFLPEVIKTGKWMGEDYPIKVCYMTASTAPMGNTNSQEFLEAFRMLDFVVVEDVAMSPNINMLADMILPAAHPFERNCVHYSGLEREIPFAPKMVEPAFEAVSDAQITIDIAKAMGHADVMPKDEDEALEQCFQTEPYISAGVTVENLKKQHTIRYMPKGLIYPAGAYTPTGRCEIYCENPVVRVELGLNPDPSHHRMAEMAYPVEAWPTTDAMKTYPLA